MEYRIVEDPVYGYRRVDPLPDEKQVTKFYREKYYEKVREGKSAAELSRLLRGDNEAASERSWLRATLYADISYMLSQCSGSKRVLDVGCGTGEFISYLQENGFDATGIEPSDEAAAVAGDGCLSIFRCTFEEFVELHNSRGMQPYDAVVLINVLEHVPNPAQLIELSKMVMAPTRGTICVRVPNDFNELQAAAVEKVNTKPWWIALPDHINYFSFFSLESLLKRSGFEVIYSQGDFPMELFLLMGDDYVRDKELGKLCHRKRMSFEKEIPGELRRRIYKALAAEGLGRNCLVFGRIEL